MHVYNNSGARIPLQPSQPDPILWQEAQGGWQVVVSGTSILPVATPIRIWYELSSETNAV
jgi:hypothetical protein